MGPTAIIGLFSSSTGLGRGASLIWHDYQTKNKDIVALDVSSLFNMKVTTAEEGVVDVANFDPDKFSNFIIHLNPPQILFIILKLKLYDWKKNQKVIAFWAWELELAPKTWKDAAEFVDEIWVPSPLVAEAIGRRIGSAPSKPIKVKPYSVPVLSNRSQKDFLVKQQLRKNYKLDKNVFIAGFSFSVMSSYARKNPLGVVKAFQLAFPKNIRDVKLFLRCYDLDFWSPGRIELKAECLSDDRIILFDDPKKKIPIIEFYQIIDVYVSLHRSEGYGLTLVEASELGIPVLATDWWLSPDIAARKEVIAVSSSCVPVNDPQGFYPQNGTLWAEPNLEDAAKKLKGIRRQIIEG